MLSFIKSNGAWATWASHWCPWQGISWTKKWVVRFLSWLSYLVPLEVSLRGHCESLWPICSHILLKTREWAKVWLFPQPKGFHIQNSQVLFSSVTNTVFSLTAITHKHHLTLSHEWTMSYCKYFNKLHRRKWISSSHLPIWGYFRTVTNEIQRLAINGVEAHTRKAQKKVDE